MGTRLCGTSSIRATAFLINVRKIYFSLGVQDGMALGQSERTAILATAVIASAPGSLTGSSSHERFAALISHVRLADYCSSSLSTSDQTRIYATSTMSVQRSPYSPGGAAFLRMYGQPPLPPD
jgi:hypothetical protein